MEIRIDDLWHAEVQALTNEPGVYTYKLFKQEREILSGAWDAMYAPETATQVEGLTLFLTKLVKDFTDATRELKTIKQILDSFGDSGKIHCDDKSLLTLRPDSWGWTINDNGFSYVTINSTRAVIGFYFADRLPVFLLAHTIGNGLRLELDYNVIERKGQ